MPTVITSAKFEKAFRKLSKRVQAKTVLLKQEFEIDPYFSKLKTHKFHGKFQDYHAFSINRKHRVIFEFIDKQTVLFLEIGTHEIYR